jgi:hypothetical protein
LVRTAKGKPRVHDLRLAERLNFGRDRDVRKLIARNSKLLEMHGKLVCCTLQQTRNGGRPGKEYWLNDLVLHVHLVQRERPGPVVSRPVSYEKFTRWRGELGES